MWTGIGAAGTLIMGVALFGETLNPAKIAGIVLVMTGHRRPEVCAGVGATALPHVRQAHIQITGHGFHQGLHLVLEEMVRAGNGLLVDHDTFLGL